MFKRYSLLLLMVLAIFWPADTRWKFQRGNHRSKVGREIMASFSIESVQVGCRTIHALTIFISFGWKLQLRAMAPPKSYPIRITFFFELSENSSNNLVMKSMACSFSLNFYDLEVNFLPQDLPKPGKSTEQKEALTVWERQLTNRFQSVPSHPLPQA